MAATVPDLYRALLDHSYDIVHLAVHGTEDSRFMQFADEQNQCVNVLQSSLSKLFSARVRKTGCIVLNACNSVGARPLDRQRPAAIAMKGALNDDHALVFTRWFYTEITAGRSFRSAFDRGCLAVRLEFGDDPDFNFQPEFFAGDRRS